MIIQKDPDAKKPIRVNWARWLQGSTIASVQWSEDTGGLSFSDQAFDGTTATVYLSGGTLGRRYEVQCRIVTNDAIPRTEVRNVTILVLRMYH